MDFDHVPTTEPRPKITTKDVVRFLESLIGNVDLVRRVGQGEWSTAFSFSHRGSEFVVRFGAHRDDFDKDQFAATFASTNLQIPHVYKVGEAFDGFFAISKRAFGTFLDDLKGTQMKALLPALFEMLDALRNVDVSNFKGYGAWDAKGIGSQLSWRSTLLDVGSDHHSDRTYGWRKKLKDSPVGSAAFEEAFNHLTTVVDSCPEIRHLVHSDLLNRNVLVGNGRITAVIDWGCGLYGDFLYDVAWLAFWSPWYPAWRGIDFVVEAAAHYAEIGFKVPGFSERIRCYQIHIGLAGLAYRAYREDWDEVERRGKRALEISTRIN